MKEIPLTQNQVSLVDDADFDWLSQWKWFAHWCVGTQSFYAARNEKRGDGSQYTLKMHRFIMGLKEGDKREVDHRESGATLDNRRHNLRVVTHLQNSTNRRARKGTKAGLKGVSWHSRDNVWEASIRILGKLKHLGTFKTAQDAHEAYQAAALTHFGEFARFE